MTESNFKKLKAELSAYSPDNRKAVFEILESEQKRAKREIHRNAFAPIRKSWTDWLSSDGFKWSIFGTLTAQGGLTGKQIERHVAKWFQMVVRRLEKDCLPISRQLGSVEDRLLTDSDLKIFWVAETNTKSVTHLNDRFHLHILIQAESWILNELFVKGKYQVFNTFNLAWQYTQGRKPFIYKSDPETGLEYKHELQQFRTHFVELDSPKGNKPLLRSNRVKYCAKYLSKDAIQYGFLTPSGSQPAILLEGSWVDSNSYEYEYSKKKALQI